MWKKSMSRRNSSPPTSNCTWRTNKREAGAQLDHEALDLSDQERSSRRS
jgi:hypothetical protein